MTEKKKSYSWIILVVLLCLGWVMIWMYRSILTPINSQVMETLGLTSNKQFSLIASFYFFAYVMFQVPAGIIADRIDKKIVLSFSFFMFAAAIFFMSRTSSISFYYAGCVMAGVACAFYYSAAFSLSNNEIDKSKRNVANAIINSGTAIGIMFGVNIASTYVVVYQQNWQMMLAGVALAVLLTSIAFFMLLKDNNKRTARKNITDAETRQMHVSGNYFHPTKIAMYFVLFCSAYAYFMIVNWLPNFLEQERGFVGGSAGLVSSLVAMVSIPGSLFFGAIVDKFHDKKYPIMIALLVAAAVSLFSAVFFQGGTMIIICLITYGLIGKLALDPLLISSVSDLSNKYKLATSLSIYNCIGMSASFVAPYVAGVIKDTTSNVTLAFYMACVVLLLGAASLVAMVCFYNPKKL